MTDTPDDNERPAAACILHRPPREGWPWRLADPSYRTCSHCLDRLRERLADIGKRYRRLDPTPGATGDGTRGAPGFGSRSPASDHVIALTDPRSSQTARTWRGSDGRLHLEDERPALSIWSALDTVSWEIAEALDLQGPDNGLTVDEQLRWIDHRLNMATQSPVCVEVSRVLRLILAALRPVTGDPRPRRVGKCPNVVDEDTQQPCGQALYAPATSDTIRCHTCTAEWPRSQWLELGLALQADAS